MIGNEGARTATGGAARAASTVAVGEDDRWPSRPQWAADRRTAYGDDLDQVAETVSAEVADYGTTAELAHAAGELRQRWAEMGRRLRQANEHARRRFPLHGHRTRTAATTSALWKALEALSPDDRAVVDEACQLKAQRQAVSRAMKELTDGRLGLFTTHDVLRSLPADRCRTYRTIVDRWQSARGAAGEAFLEDVARRQVDDDAWRRELDRRASIQLARALGHTAGSR